MKNTALFLLAASGLIAMHYFFERTDFLWQLGLYSLLFGIYYVTIIKESVRLEFWKGVLLAISLRLLLIPVLPVLSDDYFRFIFDGQLLLNGINPYLYLPEDSMNMIGGLEGDPYWEQLLEEMNSTPYFSVYPPLHQVFFGLAALGGEQLLINVIILRFVIIFFEVLTFYFLYRILKQDGQSIHALWLYAFNPLVILELSGNLHFEGIVLCGLLLSVWMWQKQQAWKSSLAWICAVGVKLIPLINGPLWLKAWKSKKLFVFFGFGSLCLLIMFSPLLVENGFEGFFESLRLYQKSFEFNASFYYIIRNVWEAIVGYNPIVYLGPTLSVFTLTAILVFTYYWKMKNMQDLAEGMVWIYLIYLLFQSVVHPWYLIPAFGLSVLTQNRLLLVWTAMVFLSYSAYMEEQVREKPFLLILEYGTLFMFFYRMYLQRFAKKIFKNT